MQMSAINVTLTTIQRQVTSNLHDVCR